MQYKHSSTAKIGIHAENVQGPIYRVGQNGPYKKSVTPAYDDLGKRSIY